MNDNELKTKQYIVKNIPPTTWRQFKIKFLQDDMNTYNECLLKLIDKYSKGDIVV